MNAMRSSRALPPILAVIAMASLDAQAQTLPWPTDPPPAGAPVAAPSPMMAPPAQMAPAMAPPSMQAGPPGGGPACLQEFTKLRTETEKRGAEAKAGQERKVSREEMCKLIQSYANAEGKWVKYAKDNTASCGIPAQLAQQLTGVHARTLMIRKQICATGPAAGGPPPPAAPSLSDALGTAQLPVPESAKKSGPGTFDTLTGNAITR